MHQRRKKAIELLTQISAEAAAKSDKGFDVAQAKAAWLVVGAATAEVNDGSAPMPMTAAPATQAHIAATQQEAEC